MPVMSYPGLVNNATWNIFAKKIGNIKVNDNRKKVEITCYLGDLNDLKYALKVYKRYTSEITTSQKKEEATITLKTVTQTAARNIGADLMVIQTAGAITTMPPKKDEDDTNNDNSGKSQTVTTSSGQTVPYDGTLTQEDIDKEKTKETINSIFSKRNIIIAVVVIVIGIVGYIIYKKKFSKK